jgi:capsular polysaccharide biosynthesis protein
MIPQYCFEHRSRIISFGIDDRLGIVNTKRDGQLSRGIALFGNGAFNWYHWLIEILPIAMLSNDLSSEFQKFPFLVPQEYEKYPSYRDSLEIFRRGRQVVPLIYSKQYHVEDLVLIDSPVHGPFNMRSGVWPAVSDYRQNMLILRKFRERILSALSVKRSTPEGLYFLARGNSRRNYNQHELSEIAESLGFTVIYPETLSFREQVELFYSARIIVGASGGAWANTLFCQSGSKGLTWTFPEYKGFCVYSNLAMVSGLELSYIYSRADRPILSTGAAYDMSYSVDVKMFRTTLKSLVVTG